MKCELGLSETFCLKKKTGFPGIPVVRDRALSLLRAWGQSLIWELRSYKPRGADKQNCKGTT